MEKSAEQLINTTNGINKYRLNTYKKLYTFLCLIKYFYLYIMYKVLFTNFTSKDTFLTFLLKAFDAFLWLPNYIFNQIL